MPLGVIHCRDSGGRTPYHRLREVPFQLNPIFSDNADCGVSGAVWPLRIPARPRTAAGARLAGQPWAGDAVVAS